MYPRFHVGCLILFLQNSAWTTCIAWNCDIHAWYAAVLDVWRLLVGEWTLFWNESDIYTFYGYGWGSGLHVVKLLLVMANYEAIPWILVFKCKKVEESIHIYILFLPSFILHNYDIHENMITLCIPFQLSINILNKN